MNTFITNYHLLVCRKFCDDFDWLQALKSQYNLMLHTENMFSELLSIRPPQDVRNVMKIKTYFEIMGSLFKIAIQIQDQNINKGFNTFNESSENSQKIVRIQELLSKTALKMRDLFSEMYPKTCYTIGI